MHNVIAAERKVVQVANMAKTLDITANLDAVLKALVSKLSVSVKCCYVFSMPLDVNTKTEAPHYPHMKS